ncbi:MAG: type II toxin-antitoxin system Phd/YefM family antitoxin [Chloroflexi bacterium]|nr:type II toxin-antitoxin system Phd/YefM family antitoxin [Chloroflexota bacterium]
MLTRMSVADAKKHLSELMSRVVYKNERFLIERRGKPMAALVSAEDLAQLEQEPTASKGLRAAVGAWADFEDLDQVIDDIYRQREQSTDRPVSFEA